MRPIVTAFAVVLSITVLACTSLAGQDRKNVERTKKLRAEKETILKRLAEIDAEIALLEGGKSKLPQPFEDIDAEINAFNEHFSIVEVRYGKKEDERKTIIWTLKAKGTLTGRELRDALVGMKAVFYEVANGVDKPIKDFRLKRDHEIYASDFKLNKGEAFDVWLFLFTGWEDHIKTKAAKMAIREP